MNTKRKLILIFTSLLILIIWYREHTSSVKTSIPDFTYTYSVKKISNGENRDGPLIIALHGNGDTVSNFYKSLLKDLPVNATVILIQGPYEYQMGYAWPMGGADLAKYGDALAVSVKTLAEKYKKDEKPILTGFSGGGFMAWYQAAKYPEHYSSIIPVSGALATEIPSGNENQAVSIIALHGEKDQVIPFASGLHSADTFKKAGYDVRFIRLPGDHLSVFMKGRTEYNSLFRSLYGN